LIKEAISGNVQAIREVGDRTEGKPAQAIALDLEVNDWRREAARYGLTPDDIIRQIQPLIEQSVASSGDTERD
jgi:Cu/Ag efflux pump CusA